MAIFNPEINIKSKNEYLDHYLARLKLLMSDFSDEIPKEIIHSPDEDNKYKVRAAWWSSVTLNIYGLKEKGLISKELSDEYDQICEFHQKNLNEGGLTKKEDIDAVNAFLEKVIKILENQEVN
jgi:hypothetical protein